VPLTESKSHNVLAQLLIMMTVLPIVKLVQLNVPLVLMPIPVTAVLLTISYTKTNVLLPAQLVCMP
jgi:hypothetical protein